jgi:hypothetical protein
VEAPNPVAAAGANMTPHVDGGHVNEVEARPEDAPGRAALIPGSPRGLGFSPPHETTLDGVGLLLGPLISWIWELVSWGCWAP